MVFIEIGNTSVKGVRITATDRLFLFKINIHHRKVFEKELKNLNDGEKVVISSVRKDVADIVYSFRDRLTIFQISTGNLGKIKLDYKTPDTLGIDRVMACVGAAVHAKGKDVIVVDAGTACTIDFMSKEFIFRGGVIMPGLAVYQHAMKDALPELPAIRLELPGSFPGQSTDEAIKWGLFGGFIHAVESFIDKYRNHAKDSELYITGGDGKIIADHLQGTYNKIYKEDLVFEGMDKFLKLNDISL